MRPRLLPVLVLFLLGARAGQAEPDGVRDELLQGVRAFRAERYPEALTVFRRVEQSRAVPEIGFYLGITLHKVGRHAEALAAFRAARRAGLREPVASYYEALSCFRLGLLQRARQGFAALAQPDGGAGPRLREGAQRFLQAIDVAVGQQPAQARYEAALQRAQAASGAEALEWLEEGALLLRDLPDRRGAAPRLQRLLERLPPGEDTMAVLRQLE